MHDKIHHNEEVGDTEEVIDQDKYVQELEIRRRSKAFEDFIYSKMLSAIENGNGDEIVTGQVFEEIVLIEYLTEKARKKYKNKYDTFFRLKMPDLALIDHKKRIHPLEVTIKFPGTASHNYHKADQISSDTMGRIISVVELSVDRNAISEGYIVTPVCNPSNCVYTTSLRGITDNFYMHRCVLHPYKKKDREAMRLNVLSMVNVNEFDEYYSTL